MKELAVKAVYYADSFNDFELSNLTDGKFDNVGATAYRSFRLLLDIGQTDEDWTEHFSVVVCTPDNRPRNNPKGRFLLVRNYHNSTVTSGLMQTVKSCERDTWENCLSALRKRFRWEYD
ncbi:MAG: hypothetical protein EOP06_25250 [Proteobacteria bacterium]|nr:immunity protein 8 of polymorphic toxin system [Rhizobium sp. PP-WC-1G-195]RYZ80477.1 MAG: hypothetical protein EOP06_25250 [Pseudomonadota bacterium]TCQ05467.1 immunity protein 8 of polymorphic toxin system [Rhizobium sp. PP-F2F-G36]